MAQINVKAEVNIEARYRKGITRLITVQSFMVLSSKMNELHFFNFFTSEVEVKMEAEIKIKVRC